MQASRKVVFLESLSGVESLFTRGLRLGARAAGWTPKLVFLADAAGNARTEAEVRSEILAENPETVCFLMDAPLSLEHLWDDPALAAVDKLSLWFDDYLRSPRTLGHPETWTDWQNRHGVRVGIWDGYWRQQWKRLTGAEAFPIHLAADPTAFDPEARPWKPEWCERAVFIGTIPSLKSLEKTALALPAPAARLLQEVITAMWECPWPIRPYEFAQSKRTFLGPKYRMAIDSLLRSPLSLALWNQLIWRWGKRIARLRGLSAVAEAGPLAILSGHGTELYADEAELRTALPEGTDWVYADTRKIPSSSWSALFRTGKFQVQITDPQSIDGGLPFRIFECAACGVPLLSDHRPELEELFPPSSGLTTAKDEAILCEAAAGMFGSAADELAERGRQFRDQFLKGHTWEIRWRQLARK